MEGRRLFIFAVATVSMFMVSGFAVQVANGFDNHGVGSSTPAIFHSMVRNSVASADSLNWAGYVVSSSNKTVTAVTASFQVPSVTSSRQTTYVAVWAGLDGASDGTVEQAGILAESAHGSVVYMAWTEFYPAAPTYAAWSPVPGNVITVTVSTPGYNQAVTATVTDVSTGQSYSNSATSSTYLLSSAEWIVERPSTASGLTTLANFGTANFGSAYTGSQTGITDTATVSGIRGTIGSFQPSSTVTVLQLSMVNSSLQVLASPSGLTGTNGDSFSVSYASSSGGGSGGGHGGGGHGGGKK